MSEANSTVKLYDGSTLLGSVTANGSGAWSLETGALANGDHALTATATDVAGNISSGSSAFEVTVNAIQPAVTITPSNFIQSSKGTGLFMGSAGSNDTISIADGNTGASLGHATAGATGTWAVVMANLSNSVHSFVATAIEPSGNAGSVNVVYGTIGNDTITNGAANEILFGNGGNDTFAFSGNIGKDTIADFQANNDVIQLSHNAFASFSDVLAHAAQVGSDVMLHLDASNSVTLHNTVLNQLTANNFHLV
jgi:Ca2+-binding RTX toxin-like protein